MKYFLAIALGFWVLFLNAQNVIEFDKEIHDFGEIEELGGFAETIFNFVNTGEEPIKVTSVRASCGCTTPGWSKEEIMPGDSGFVKARYNPRNRPGKFRKSLKVRTTKSEQTVYITGFVKPKPRDVLEEYSVAAGDLRMKFRTLNLGKMTTEKVVTKEFDVYNAGENNIKLQHHLMKVPAHVSIAMEPETIESKQKGKLKLTYDPIKKDDLGFLSDNLTIVTDSAATEQNEFNVISTVEEFFPEMTAEELDTAPKLQIENRVFDYGKVPEGTIVEAEFNLTNGGKKKLNFRKIKSNCSCVTYELKSSNIKKGKTQVLKLAFDTTGRRGNQYKNITLFSNDPVSPTQMITIKGTIEKNAGE